jgi:hypothetical protein
MIDVNASDLIPLQAVADRPEVRTAFDTSPSRTTLYVWTNKGIGGVRLLTWRIGSGRFTTLAALREFLTQTGRLHPAHERIGVSCDAVP